jgi:hypothetical protein
MVDQQAARSVVDTITGTWRAQALYTAVALQLPDHVAAGCTTPDRLAHTAGASEDGVRRLMRLLAGMEVFAGSERTGYRLTPVGNLLRADHPDSMRDMCLMYGQEFYRAWGCAEQAIRTASSGFERSFGRPLGAYLQQEDGAGVRFQRAMNAGNVFFSDVPRVFDFTGRKVVVDVGGGSGQLLSTVLRAAPESRGMLVDLAHMVAIGRKHLAGTVGLDRCELVAGDIFASVPFGGDVYLLSRVLQDWDDKACVRLLENCRRAMSEPARLLILDRVIPEDGSALLPMLWDLHLLMISGGAERTLAGYASIVDKAGLRIERIIDLPLEMSILVAAPSHQEDNR